MKKVKINNKGLTLMEVIIATLLLSIVIIALSTAFANSFTNIAKGKDLTIETFNLQEDIEEKITKVSLDSINNYNKTIKVFGKDVKYDKVTALSSNRKRSLAMYVSQAEMGILPTPEITDLSLKAYDKDDKEIYPWYEEGTYLKVKYKDIDPEIFQVNYSWYRSKQDKDIPIENPSFSYEYDIIKSRNSVYKDLVPSSDLEIKYNDNVLESNRFYHFGIIPYSDAGRLGKLAMNEDRLLVIERTSNSYWNNLIEDTYLGKVTIRPDTMVLTMHNINQPTLNIENDNSNKDNGSLWFYPLEELKTKNGSFKTIVDFQFDEKTIKQDAGVGVFLGDYNANKENGIIFLLDQKNSKITVKKLEEGTRKYDIGSFKVPNNFDWSKRYKWSFDFLNGSKKDITVSYKGQEDESFIELESSNLNLTNLNFSMKDIGLKTWSDYNIKDEKNEEHKYVYNLTAHFYDIGFEELKNYDENFGMFMFGGGLNISAKDIIGDGKSIYFDSNLNTDNIKNNGHIKVSNIYVKENLKLPSDPDKPGGSHQLGSKEKPGEIHVGGDFIESGSREIYGDIYIGGSFSSNNSSSSIYGDMHVGKDLVLWEGSMKLYGDIFVNGNLKLKDANIHGNIYVNGDVELGWTPTLSANAKIYYTGKLIHPDYYDTEILKKLIEVSYVEEAKKPQIPVPKYPELKESS